MLERRTPNHALRRWAQHPATRNEHRRRLVSVIMHDGPARCCDGPTGMQQRSIVEQHRIVGAEEAVGRSLRLRIESRPVRLDGRDVDATHNDRERRDGVVGWRLAQATAHLHAQAAAACAQQAGTGEHKRRNREEENSIHVDWSMLEAHAINETTRERRRERQPRKAKEERAKHGIADSAYSASMS
jgi:hypothetical protein